MSYTLAPYLVDLEELRRAVGSKDAALVTAVLAADGESHNEEEEDGEDLSLRQAVRQLVMGEPLQNEGAYQYGYALEQICRHVGENLPGDLWCGIGWEVLEETGMEEVLEKSGPPVPLPPTTDFPRIGYLTREQITALAGKAESGRLITAAPSGRKPRRSLGSRLMGMVLSRLVHREPMRAEDLQEILDEYAEWLREAKAKNRDLVFFYY